MKRKRTIFSKFAKYISIGVMTIWHSEKNCRMLEWFSHRTYFTSRRTTIVCIFMQFRHDIRNNFLNKRMTFL
ncbi:unnamed protein product [Rodentolepis nana]|uniref:Uncharacterized protein n=1 Tax=Rodentolepis nana TaxID=102285 RepID=A0A0R3TA18_RODNA|nr:unnamed protein product [Rodentolepis nana]